MFEFCPRYLERVRVCGPFLFPVRQLTQNGFASAPLYALATVRSSNQRARSTIVWRTGASQPVSISCWRAFRAAPGASRASLRRCSRPRYYETFPFGNIGSNAVDRTPRQSRSGRGTTQSKLALAATVQ